MRFSGTAACPAGGEAPRDFGLCDAPLGTDSHSADVALCAELPDRACGNLKAFRDLSGGEELGGANG